MEKNVTTADLLHLTGAIHRAIADLDRLADRETNSESVKHLEQIRTDLNSAVLQVYGF